MNYFGQGALLIADPKAVENPFFKMMPSFALYPMVFLSTGATVIASQALISGVFSLTLAGRMLGLLPRVSIKHTSAHERGQIYVPFVNWLLMIATIGLVLGFKSSSNLAAAYGIAVTLTMVITTILAYFLVRHVWGWSIPKAAAVSAVFLAPELVFMGRQRHQDRARRLVSAGRRRRHFRDDAELEARPRDSGATPSKSSCCRSTISST